MTTSYIVIALVVLIVATIVVSIYWHKKHVHYHEADLRQALQDYFREKGVEEVREKDIWRLIQKKYNCSRKDTLYLTGLARKRGFIHLEDGKARLGE